MAELERRDTEAIVAGIVASQLKIDKSTITAQATLHDLGADSVDLVEIVMRIEEQCNIKIDDEKADNIANAQQLVDYVHSLRIKN